MQPSRNFYVPFLLCLACLIVHGQTVLLLSSAMAAESTKPNVVFILTDDLGVMDIGAYNSSTFYETPHVDRLAREGMRFAEAYTACNVCSPTRYSIMTGKYPVRSGITNYLVGTRSERFEPAPLNTEMSLAEITLGEAFKENGYQTAFLGKWHLGNVKEYGPHLQGFDIVRGDFSYIAPTWFGLDLPVHPKLTQPRQKSEFLTEQITQDAILVLEAVKDKPFFLYLSFYQVHSPILASEEYVAPYRKKKADLKLQSDDSLDYAEEEQALVSAQKPRLTRIRQNNEIYAGMMDHADKCVGRVLDQLDRLGLAENTIVVFMSDNGGLTTAEGSPTSNLPYRCGKGWNYEGGLRAPMIVRWPRKVKAGTVATKPVISTDFYPTLLELCGLASKPDQHLDGVSFAAQLEGKPMNVEHDALFWHYPHYSNQGGFPSSAIRMGDYKLIVRLEEGRSHLYNLANDPGERTDLAATMPEQVALMKKKLFQWYADTGAKFLEPKNGVTPWTPFVETLTTFQRTTD